MAAHKYWRVTFTASGTSGVSVGGIEMRATSGGPNLAVAANGSAAAPAYVGAGQEPDKAFDDNPDTQWCTYGAPPRWILWTFTVATEIAEITIRHTGVGFGAEFRGTAGTIEFSDDDATYSAWATFELGSGNYASVVVEPPVPASASADLTLPQLTAAIFGGGSAQILLPMLNGAAHGGSSMQATLPALQVRAVGSAGVRSRAELQLPRLVMEAAGGGTAKLQLPVLAISAAGTVPLVGIANLVLPAMQGEAAGRTSAMGSADLVLPMVTLLGQFGGRAAMVLPALSGTASGVAGGVAHVALTLPRLTVSAAGAQQSHGRVDIVLPMLRMVDAAHAHLVLPSFQIVAIGGAVVPVVYEAYAVNLGKTQQGQPYEVTQYTNFPFTKIVRFKGDYYGVGADGLYLLGGDDDLGEPIPWAWQTHLSDFGTKLRKTPDAMYLTGRMGPSACAMVAVGEKRTFTYQMRNWRGEFAQAYRVKMGKGIKSNYLGFGASDECGGVVDVDVLDPRIVAMTRNI